MVLVISSTGDLKHVSLNQVALKKSGKQLCYPLFMKNEVRRMKVQWKDLF